MFDRTLEIVKDGLASPAYPSAAVAIGRGNDVFVRCVLGNRQENPDVQPADEGTLYDLASISKLVGTTQAALRMIEEGKLGLYDELGQFFDCPKDKSGITVKNLMTHTSGLSPHLDLQKRDPDPSNVVGNILSSDLVYSTGEEVRYSCMGYIILAKLLEKIEGRTLDRIVQEYVFDPIGMKTACYNPVSDNVVTTEFRPWYKDLNEGWTKGFVHDENARFLGGVSGNAGIFASIDDMIAFGKMISNRGEVNGKPYLTRRMFDHAVTDYTNGKAESRGLGFQLKGDRYFIGGDMMSRGSYGHSGFTGTSIFCDAETGVYGVFLTNAVHYGRNKTALFRIRRMFYNAMMNEYLREFE